VLTNVLKLFFGISGSTTDGTASASVNPNDDAFLFHILTVFEIKVT
jgi:hypothetical protein